MGRWLFRLVIAAITGAAIWATGGEWTQGLLVAALIVVTSYASEIWDARKADLSPGARRRIVVLAWMVPIGGIVGIIVTKLI
jgi:hypothetical protein